MQLSAVLQKTFFKMMTLESLRVRPVFRLGGIRETCPVCPTKVILAVGEEASEFLRRTSPDKRMHSSADGPGTGRLRFVVIELNEWRADRVRKC